MKKGGVFYLFSKTKALAKKAKNIPYYKAWTGFEQEIKG